MPSPNAFRGPLPVPELPHAAPFRLIDRIVSAELGRGYLVAERRLTLNDALWPAESQSSSLFFASRPESGMAAALVFPPTLLIEALCQAAAALNSLSLAASAQASAPAPSHHGLLVAIRDMKFPAFAYVGETLTLEVEQKERLGAVIAFAVRAAVTASDTRDPRNHDGDDDDDDAAAADDDENDNADNDNANHADRAQPRQVASGRLLFAVTLA